MANTGMRIVVHEDSQAIGRTLGDVAEEFGVNLPRGYDADSKVASGTEVHYKGSRSSLREVLRYLAPPTKN